MVATLTSRRFNFNDCPVFGVQSRVFGKRICKISPFRRVSARAGGRAVRFGCSFAVRLGSFLVPGRCEAAGLSVGGDGFGVTRH